MFQITTQSRSTLPPSSPLKERQHVSHNSGNAAVSHGSNPCAIVEAQRSHGVVHRGANHSSTRQAQKTIDCSNTPGFDTGVGPRCQEHTAGICAVAATRVACAHRRHWRGCQSQPTHYMQGSQNVCRSILTDDRLRSEHMSEVRPQSLGIYPPTLSRAAIVLKSCHGQHGSSVTSKFLEAQVRLEAVE